MKTLSIINLIFTGRLRSRTKGEERGEFSNANDATNFDTKHDEGNDKTQESNGPRNS